MRPEALPGQVEHPGRDRRRAAALGAGALGLDVDLDGGEIHHPVPPWSTAEGEEHRVSLHLRPQESVELRLEGLLGHLPRGRDPGLDALVRPERFRPFPRLCNRSVAAASGKGDRGLVVRGCAARDPGSFDGAPSEIAVASFRALEPSRLVLDPAGYLVVYPDRGRGLVLEHYRNDGVLDCVLEGVTSAAVGATAVERGLVSRLDHAIYLGRELARAEESLRTGLPYVQDRAPEPVAPAPAEECGCEGST